MKPKKVEPREEVPFFIDEEEEVPAVEVAAPPPEPAKEGKLLAFKKATFAAILKGHGKENIDELRAIVERTDDATLKEVLNEGKVPVEDYLEVARKVFSTAKGIYDFAKKAGWVA